MNSSSSINSSSASSGYNSSGVSYDDSVIAGSRKRARRVNEEEPAGNTAVESNNNDESIEQAAGSNEQAGANQAACLAHIINWITKSGNESNKNLAELCNKMFVAAKGMAKNLLSVQPLAPGDQELLLNENLNEIFLLYLAETKSFHNDGNLHY